MLEYCNGDILQFSIVDSFLTEDSQLELIPNANIQKAKIYYTLDGSTPNVNSTLYLEPISLACTKAVSCVNVKAVLYYKGEYSEVFCKSYFIGKQINEVFDLDIISIMIDEDELFAEGTGIFLQENVQLRGDEWTRPAYVEILTSKGELCTSQWIGLEVAGKTSSLRQPVSLQLKADEQYDETHPYFSYTFSQEPDAGNVLRLKQYKSLKLHSGSQDRFVLGSQIRASIVADFAEASNYDGIYEQDRAIVFLNGKFYALVTVQSAYTSSNIKNRYGLDSTELVRYKGSANHGMRNMGYSHLLSEDLNTSTIRAQLEQLLDIQDCLTYYAIEILLNNTDWISNNVGQWRYIGEMQNSNSYNDGKTRFFLQDVDMIYANNIPDETYSGDALHLLKTDKLFSALMTVEDYQKMFLNILCDLMNTSFSDENIYQIILRQDEIIDSALALFHQHQTEKAAIVDTQDQAVSHILQYALERKNVVIQQISKMFDLDEMFQLEIQTDPGAVITWNNMELFHAQDSVYLGHYFPDCSLKVQAKNNPGYRITGWIVNGEYVDCGDSLTIDQACLVNNFVSICPVSERLQVDIVINEFVSSGGSDWIELRNAGTQSASLDGYSLTDDPDNPNRYPLDGLTIAADSVLSILAKNNYYSLNNLICNFNLSGGETLYLFHNGRCIDSVYCMFLEDGESYARYQDSAIWKVHSTPTWESRNAFYIQSQIESQHTEELGTEEPSQEALQLAAHTQILISSQLAARGINYLLVTLNDDTEGITEKLHGQKNLSYILSETDISPRPNNPHMSHFLDGESAIHIYYEIISHLSSKYNNIPVMDKQNVSYTLVNESLFPYVHELYDRGKKVIFKETPTLEHKIAPTWYADSGASIIVENKDLPEGASCVVISDYYSPALLTSLAQSFSRLVYVISRSIPYEVLSAEMPDHVINICDAGDVKNLTNGQIVDEYVFDAGLLTTALDGTDSINYSIDINVTNDNLGIYYIDGWAYMDEYDTEHITIGVALVETHTDKSAVMLPTKRLHTLDIDLQNPVQNNLSYARFTCSISAQMLQKGIYDINLILGDPTGQIYVCKTGYKIHSFGNTPESVRTLKKHIWSEQVVSLIDSISNSFSEGIYRIDGFAFLPKQDAVPVQVFLFQNGLYIPLTSQIVQRNDVTQYYHQEYNLDISGFSALANVSHFPGGNWEVVVGIQDLDGIIHMKSTGEVIYVDGPPAIIESELISEMDFTSSAYTIDNFEINRTGGRIRGTIQVEELTDDSHISILLKSGKEYWRLETLNHFNDSQTVYFAGDFSWSSIPPNHEWELILELTSESSRKLVCTERIIYSPTAHAKIITTHTDNPHNRTILNIDQLNVEQKVLHASGFAFVEGKQSQKNSMKSYLVNAHYQAPLNVTSVLRPDVTQYFSAHNYNLDWSGFKLEADLSELPRGQWKLVIEIEDEEGISYRLESAESIYID